MGQLPPFFLFHSYAVADRSAGDVAVAPPAPHVAVAAPSLPGDVNEDGVVDVEDLLMVTADLGPPPFDHPRADANGDGAVDVGDMVAVAIRLGHGAPGTAVLFPDANLEAAVREALAKPEGDITVEDLQGLTELVADDRGIADLTGLEHATNLERLIITGAKGLVGSGTTVEDLAPLSGLIKLRELDLLWNQISNLAPLSGLTNLRTLHLGENQISDLAPLSGLIKLSQLYLEDNQISDLAPLWGLTNLEVLVLDGNEISDLTSLSGLMNLGFLFLSGNQISDLAPLSGLTTLHWLSLDDNEISDLTSVSGLAKMQFLWLSGNQISDLGPLEGLTNLRFLHLQENQINDIGPLVDNQGLGEGDYVDLRGNPLSEESLNGVLRCCTRRQVEGRVKKPDRSWWNHERSFLRSMGGSGGPGTPPSTWRR